MATVIYYKQSAFKERKISRPYNQVASYFLYIWRICCDVDKCPRAQKNTRKLGRTQGRPEKKKKEEGWGVRGRSQKH